MTHALRLYFPPAAVQRGKRMDSAFAGAWTGALPKAVLQFSFPAFAPLPISPYAPLALPDAAQRFMQSVLRALRTQHLLWQAWHLYFRQISQIQENIMATAKTPSKKPAAKAGLGEHDENVTFEHVARMVGERAATALRETTLALYTRAAEIARERGIILADTKFEFGAGPDGELVLGDEVLTPDSSRFWPADQWTPGRVTPSFDKQYVRDWLTSPASGWDRSSGQEPPALPADVVERTRARYLEAYERLTGTLLAV